MPENFPNLGNKRKNPDIQNQEPKRLPIKTNLKRPTMRHIILQLLKFKDKERILKSARER